MAEPVGQDGVGAAQKKCRILMSFLEGDRERKKGRKDR